MPKVSVLMGVYNTKNKQYLKKSINSILNQTFKDFELIICNDGSTNKCFLWAKEICKNDERVIFIENDKNMGLAYTLNHCLENATGEYIARMDDDDESSIDRLSKQLEFLESHKDVDLVSCNIKLFDDKGIYSSKEYPKKIRKEDFLFNSPIVHPAIMARRKSFDIVSGYSEAKECVRVEDYDIFMRMFAKGIRMEVIQEYLFNYREDTMTTKRRQKYKYRVNEFLVRFKGFWKLGLFPKGFFYSLKPLILGLLPVSVLKRIKR